MSRIAVVGDPDRVTPWGLGGAVVVPVLRESVPEDVAAQLPADVEVVVVTGQVAAHWVRRDRGYLMVVLP